MESESVFVEANGIKFHCVTAGEGPLCLCLHGFPETHHSWRNQVPLLASAFKVVVPDMRGYGRTDAPRRVADYRLPILMKDVKGLIEAFGYKEAVIVSHDWGAVVAVHYPETVSKLVWANALHLVDYYEMVFKRRDIRQMLKSWYVTMNQVPGLTEYLAPLGNFYMLERLLKLYAVRKEAFTPEVMEQWKVTLRQSGLRGGVNYYRAGLWAFREVAAGRLKSGRIECPVKVIWGETDKALETELGYVIEAHVDGEFDFHLIERCGHWVQQEAPEEFNEQLADFLDIKTT